MIDPHIRQTMEHKDQIAQATPAPYQALRTAAEYLSRRNLASAKAEVLNEALARLTRLCYEEDATGLCNVDGETGKILIPMPCGSKGYKKWGLYPTEANVLRRFLLTYQEHKQRYPPLYLYDPVSRSWAINIFDYTNYRAARLWLEQYAFTPKLWKAVHGALRGKN